MNEEKDSLFVGGGWEGDKSTKQRPASWTNSKEFRQTINKWGYFSFLDNEGISHNTNSLNGTPLTFFPLAFLLNSNALRFLTTPPNYEAELSEEDQDLWLWLSTATWKRKLGQLQVGNVAIDFTRVEWILSSIQSFKTGLSVIYSTRKCIQT